MKNASTLPTNDDTACCKSAVPVIVASLYFNPSLSKYSLAFSIPVTELISLLLYINPKVLTFGVISVAKSIILSIGIELDTPVMFPVVSSKDFTSPASIGLLTAEKTIFISDV